MTASGGSLWLLHDGRRVRRLAQAHPTDGTDLTVPAWSPDGSAIAYAADASEVAVMRLRDDGTPQTYAIGSLGNANASFRLAWSPDGGSLVVGRSNGGSSIVLLDLSSGDVRIIAEHGESDAPLWSPDGATLAYLHHVSTGATELVTRPLGGDGRVLATVEPMANDGSFAWSPDSRSIAFVSVDGALDVASASSGARRTLIASAVTGQLAWSRDGSTIAYVITGADSRRSIGLIQADGSATRSLPTPVIGEDPAWLSDGRLLYLDGASAGYGALNLPVTLLGATPAQTSHFLIDASNVAVSPVDSRYLVAQLSLGKDTAFFQLSVIGPDGMNDAQSTFVAGARGHGTWSPDGNAIAYPVTVGSYDGVGIEVGSSANLFYPAAALIATDATDPSWRSAATAS